MPERSAAARDRRQAAHRPVPSCEERRTLGLRALAALGTVAAIGVTLLGGGAPAQAAPYPAAAHSGGLGTNLAPVTYYGGNVVFQDLVRQAGDWVPNADGVPWGEGPRLRLRRDGWPSALVPGQVASTVIADVRYPSGRYSVTWSGAGTFSVAGQEFAGRDGRGSVALDGVSTVVLDIRATDPSDPLRDIRVRVPGSGADEIFRAAYVDQLAPYGVLRFMDWQRTNSTAGDPERRFTCGSRVRNGYYSQGTSRGASVESMVDLANAVDADPWFTIPHEATSTWIRCHARVVAQRLDPGLTPRYEFSNETWNPTFIAFHDLTDAARAAGLGGSDAFLGLQIMHARRHAAAMRVVAGVMDAADRPFVRVMAGQAANAWVLEQRLGHAGGAASTDEIAIAPYLGIPGANPFDAAEAAEIATWTPAQVLVALSRAQEEEVEPWIADHVALARTEGKRLVAYEAGQHLAGDPGNDLLTDLFVRVNRSGGIGSAYRSYLQRWDELTDGALLVHFTDVGPYTRFGSWGALEFPEQAGSPKYDELLRYAARG